MVWALGTNATSKAVQINVAKDKVKTVAEAPVEMEAADVRGFKGNWAPLVRSGAGRDGRKVWLCTTVKIILLTYQLYHLNEFL